jgi:hypothetical protein
VRRRAAVVLAVAKDLQSRTFVINTAGSWQGWWRQTAKVLN